MTEAEVPLPGGSHSEVVRVGETVHRLRRPWSAAVQDLLAHLDREGFAGAPRPQGFDDQGREVLTYLEGEVVVGDVGALAPDRFDPRLPAHVWEDDTLVRLGELVRSFHDAAATFPWAGRAWCFDAREPVETICHNELFPQNTVFRNGRPAAIIDWDTAAPAPRAWELGAVAWRWVPFFRDEKCRAHGLPTGTADKARRLRLLLDAYGMEPDVAIVQAGIERMQSFLEHMTSMAAAGSAHEVEGARLGRLDELAQEIAWVERHAADLVEDATTPG